GIDLAQAIDFLARQAGKQRCARAERLAPVPELLPVVELVHVQPANQVAHFVRGDAETQQGANDRPEHGGGKADGHGKLGRARRGLRVVAHRMSRLPEPELEYLVLSPRNKGAIFAPSSAQVQLFYRGPAHSTSEPHSNFVAQAIAGQWISSFFLWRQRAVPSSCVYDRPGGIRSCTHDLPASFSSW